MANLVLLLRFLNIGFVASAYRINVNVVLATLIIILEYSY